MANRYLARFAGAPALVAPHMHGRFEASLAALAFKKGDPRGGDAVARQWFEAAYRLDPDNDLVSSLKAWYDRDANKPNAPPKLSPSGE